MKTNRAKKELMMLGVIFLMLFFLSTEALPWGAATHAYIEDHLGKKRGLENSNEIYGGMVPDVFNYLFDYPTYLDYLYSRTHDKFLKVWKASYSYENWRAFFRRKRLMPSIEQGDKG